jgi:DNA-binding NarL/FixJ family response regulator
MVLSLLDRKMMRNSTSMSAHLAPRGLAVDLFEIDQDEYAVFLWGTDEPKPDLTEAERSVLELLVTGASNADIARARGSSKHTVANQVRSLLHKLGANSRYDLMRRYGGPHAAPRAT